jgi:hypothetical protein
LSNDIDERWNSRPSWGIALFVVIVLVLAIALIAWINGREAFSTSADAPILTSSASRRH